jgi:hypothetical protein
VPEPLPPIAPWEPPERKLYVVSDGPDAVSAAGAPALRGRAAESPADGAAAVTDTPPAAAADASASPVTDTDAADTDTAGNLPAIAGFGREISPAARFGIVATRNSGAVIRAAGKGAVKSRTWTQPPQSLSGHAAWVNDRTWIPEEVKDEPLIALLVFARKAWGWTAGLLLAGAGNAVNWLRLPQHFLAACAATGLLYLLVIR